MANQLYTPIDIFSRGQQSFANSMKNLQSIGEARRKAQADRENLDFKKKENALKLEKAKREGRISELEYKVLEGQHKEYIKQQKQILDGREAEIGIVEQQERDNADKAREITKEAYRADPAGVTAMVMQNRGRKTLEPVFKGGKIGYELVDNEKSALEKEKLRAEIAQKKGKNSVTRKDIVDLAKSLAGEFPNIDDVKAMIPEAEKMLLGESSSGGGEYDDATEKVIKENMDYYGRSREEVVSALKSKGIIK